MLPIRIMPIVYLVATLAAGGALYWLADAIGDAREAKVWAKIDETIKAANDETAEANETDAEKRALREKLRTSALIAAAKTKGTQCLLTADEATAIGAIR